METEILTIESKMKNDDMDYNEREGDFIHFIFPSRLIQNVECKKKLQQMQEHLTNVKLYLYQLNNNKKLAACIGNRVYYSLV